MYESHNKFAHSQVSFEHFKALTDAHFRNIFRRHCRIGRITLKGK